MVGKVGMTSHTAREHSWRRTNQPVGSPCKSTYLCIRAIKMRLLFKRAHFFAHLCKYKCHLPTLLEKSSVFNQLSKTGLYSALRACPVISRRSHRREHALLDDNIAHLLPRTVVNAPEQWLQSSLYVRVADRSTRYRDLQLSLPRPRSRLRRCVPRRTATSASSSTISMSCSAAEASSLPGQTEFPSLWVRSLDSHCVCVCASGLGASHLRSQTSASLNDSCDAMHWCPLAHSCMCVSRVRAPRI